MDRQPTLKNQGKDSEYRVVQELSEKEKEKEKKPAFNCKCTYSENKLWVIQGG